MGTCTDPTCYICVELPKRFPPVVACGEIVAAGKRYVAPCRLVRGHSGACKPSHRRVEIEPPQLNPARDGAPSLPGEKKRPSLAFMRRHRIGPHR